MSSERSEIFTKYHHLLKMMDPIFKSIDLINEVHRDHPDDRLERHRSLIEFAKKHKDELEAYILDEQRRFF